MTTNKVKQKYRSKAKDSFKTKLELFLYDIAITTQNEKDIERQKFKDFTITKDLIDNYTSAWQLDFNDEISGKTIKSIDNFIDSVKYEHSLIKTLEEDYIENKYPELLPYDSFKQLLEKGVCYYCGLTEEKIDKLTENGLLFKKHPTRGRFEIDRLHPNKEYTEENTVLSCYWCNNAKTDEFLGDEFLEIGKAISKIWEKRLKS